ncbi:hypothetical protein CRG98_018054 [Punica granatum]|uniref:Endonuclease/exonuclease/phosphatase domain-containing protein n=1 Tax=Punica granatum TaxID=22663 RepID=A0A2I0JYZ2_PUNGR|nr:hypothetical protein CRG98_018054 [Punica granatum]
MESVLARMMSMLPLRRYTHYRGTRFLFKDYPLGMMRKECLPKSSIDHARGHSPLSSIESGEGDHRRSRSPAPNYRNSGDYCRSDVNVQHGFSAQGVERHLEICHEERGLSSQNSSISHSTSKTEECKAADCSARTGDPLIVNEECQTSEDNSLGVGAKHHRYRQTMAHARGSFTVRDLFAADRPDILILTKTRLPKDRAETMASLLAFDKHEATNSMGHRGGILVLWNSSQERLDRAVANPSWRQAFPDGLVTHLTRVHSDHCPILVNFYPTRNTSLARPFRFETMWMSHPNFSNLVANSWNEEFLRKAAFLKEPEYITLFRPISLCNTSYEIITKILGYHALHIFYPYYYCF